MCAGGAEATMREVCRRLGGEWRRPAAAAAVAPPLLQHGDRLPAHPDHLHLTCRRSTSAW